MIKNKIKNISKVKLEFFVKNENLEDLLVSVNPNDVVFSFGEDLTKSMRVFQRKNLIEIFEGEYKSLSLDSENIESEFEEVDIPKKSFDEIKNLDNINKNEPIISNITNIENPYKDLLMIDLIFDANSSDLDEAKRQAEIYVEKTEEVTAEKKKYNYKKKPGRKKKRGPKPGNKKKKS